MSGELGPLWTSYSRSYFFSNSPVKWRFTKVVLPAKEEGMVVKNRYIQILAARLDSLALSTPTYQFHHRQQAPA